MFYYRIRNGGCSLSLFQYAQVSTQRKRMIQRLFASNYAIITATATRTRMKLSASILVSSIATPTTNSNTSRPNIIRHMLMTRSCSNQYVSSGRWFLQNQMRTYLSPIVEPPILSTIIERPITIVLAEDGGRYATATAGKNSLKNSSWHELFQDHIPRKYGCSYAYWSIDDSKMNERYRNNNNQTSSPTVIDTTTTTITLDGTLHALQNDLAHISHECVFIARGPWISWMVQFYLESLPLAGLVLIDPLDFSYNADIDEFQQVYHHPMNQSTREKDSSSSKHSLFRSPSSLAEVTTGTQIQQNEHVAVEYELFQEFIQHWDHWSLRLEPGSVPMMVLNTIDTPGFQRGCERTIKRHGISSNNESNNNGIHRQEIIPLIHLDINDPLHVEEGLGQIWQWVEKVVL